MAPSRSTGTKKTPKKASSTTGQKKTSSSASARTAKKLSQNLTTLTTKKSPSKTSSKTPSTSAKKSPQKASKVAKTPVKSTRKTKNTKSQELVYSSDLALFPYVDTFPYRLEDISEKKTCYFQCENHARKYITRYNPEYRLYCYTR